MAQGAQSSVPAGRRLLSPSQGYLRLQGGESKSYRFPRHVAPAPPCFGGPGPWRSLWELEELPKKMFCEPRGALGALPTRLWEHCPPACRNTAEGSGQVAPCEAGPQGTVEGVFQ